MRRKKKAFLRPVTAGLTAVYLLIMALATFLVKIKFAEDFTQRFRETAVYMARKINEREDGEGGWDSEEERQAFYQDLANGYLWRVNDTMLQISFGFYDSDKRLMARTRDEIGGNTVCRAESVIKRYGSFDLDDYLSPEEKEQLAAYQWESIRLRDGSVPEKYRFSIRISPDGGSLWGIYVQEITWTPSDEWDGETYKDPLSGAGVSMEMAEVDYETGDETVTGSFEQTDSRIVWQWSNPGVSQEETEKGTVLNTSMRLPYMTAYETWRDFDSWKRWCKSEYLRGFSEQGEFAWAEGIEEPPVITDSDGWYYRGRYQLIVGSQDHPVYVEMRMESSPWKAAVDYMKYVYLAGLILTLGCGGMIVHAFRKIYDAQLALEATRRDFTNAMAHELKTPLGVIRNFAENLLEHTAEEKRDYYLAQIIGQTEEMDRLVVRMIEISKLDSEEMALKSESVSFAQLVREQEEKLEPMIREKNLRVEYVQEGEFLAEGDREYLAKAVWNLLCNAVDYNIPDGRIKIVTKKDRCDIENTGRMLDDDGLVHAFDLFYTGDKSRSRKDGHMGMGLFLARKILGRCGLSLTLENTESGIRASIKK